MWTTDGGWADVLKSEFQLVIPEIRAHGKSDTPSASTEFSLKHRMSDVIAVMDDLDIDRAAYFGYSMGAVFPPTWMEDPLIRKDDLQILQPGMVFFMHMLMVNREQRMMMSLGEQAIVSDRSCEIITHAPRELPRN